MDKTIFPMACPICGKWICPEFADCVNCTRYDEETCDGCMCTEQAFAIQICKLASNIRELEELRYKLMLIEKAVNANEFQTIQVRKIKHILKGGWKYARQRVL